jgi:hypothetical protein
LAFALPRAPPSPNAPHCNVLPMKLPRDPLCAHLSPLMCSPTFSSPNQRSFPWTRCSACHHHRHQEHSAAPSQGCCVSQRATTPNDS